MAVNLSPVGGVAGQFFDNNGNPLVGGKLYTYAAGTTTPQATFISSVGGAANTNPIILNAGGRVPAEIWLTDGQQYKFVLYDANDVLIGSWDNIVGINSNFVNFVTSDEVQIATAGQTVFTLTTMQYQPGTNNLVVYVDGVNQVEGGSYSFVETNSTTVTFTSGLHVGAVVKFVSAEVLSTNVTSASTTTFTGFNSQVGVVQDIADADGSDWIGFEPDGTGAVARSVESKLRETVSVKDFGAVGDGVTDDTAAIQAAFNASQAIFFPFGAYKLTAKITVSKSTAFAIYGEGIGNSLLYWTNADGGIDVTMANNYDSLMVDGLSLRTEQAGGGTALKVTYPVSASSIFVGPRFSNVEIRGNDNTVDYWTTGFRLVNGWNAQVTGFHIQGANNTPRGMTKAISMTDCYDVIVNNCYGVRGEYGIWISDGADEGMNISQCVFIDFHTGIYFNSFQAQAGTAISDNHMNTEAYGINFQAKQQAIISGNLIYKITGSTSSYVGIAMKFGNDCRIMNNYIRNTGLTGGEIGILLDDTDNCIVMGNEFTEFNSGSVGVQVGALSGGNLISNNMTYTPGTAVVNFGLGSLKTNYAFNNFPSTVSVLEVNAATPSIGNDVNGQWKTANTLATTITNFLNGYESQIICILADDSNTTIQHNADVILKGAVDYVMSLGDIITLRRDATLWREVSRNS